MAESQQTNTQKAESDPTLSEDDRPSTVRELHDPQRLGDTIPSTKRDTSSSILSPPENWKFNKFLAKLAAGINEEELGILKGLFIGEIGRGTLEKITTARDLFDHMCRREYLNQYNLIALQSALMELKRPELVEMAMEYAKGHGNVIYCHTAPQEPVNGLTKVKFHVEGIDLEKLNRSDIERIRLNVSDWLFIPIRHVVIVGIEPSSSVIITILIPDMYADILLQKLKNNDTFGSLCDIGIDVVQIGEEEYNILGVEGAEIVETEHQSKLVSIYDQLKDKKLQLKSMEYEVIKISNEKQKLKKKNEDMQTEIETFHNMFVKSEDTNEASAEFAAKRRECLDVFMQSLHEVQEKGYDKNCISKLLQTNTSMVATRTEESHRLQLEQLIISIKELQSQVLPLQFQLSFSRILNPVMNPLFELPFTLDGRNRVILATISDRLQTSEILKLEQKYTWDHQDPLTISKNRSKSQLLVCLYLKEIQKKQVVLPLGKFVLDCLDEVARPDLKETFLKMDMEYVHTDQPAPTPTRQPSSPRQTGTAQSEQTSSNESRASKEISLILSIVHETLQIIKSTQMAGIPSNQYGKSHFDPSKPTGEFPTPFNSGAYE